MPGFIEQLAAQQGQNAANGIMGLVLGDINDRRQVRQQQRLTNQQLDAQKDMGEYNYQQQMRMWRETNYKAQMEQIKMAGLNPGLLYGMGGGGGATVGHQGGSVGGGTAVGQGGEVQAMIGMGMQRELLQAQKENIEANTEKTKAETGNVPLTGEKTKAETSSITQGIENLKAQEKLTAVQTELGQVQASVARQTIKDAMQTIENTAKKGIEEIKLLQISQDEKKQAITNLKAEVAHMAVKNALMQAQKENTNQDTKNKIQEVLESEQRIKAMSQSLAIAWDRLALETTENRIKWDDHLDKDEGWNYIKEMVPTFLIPMGRGIGGAGHTPVRGFHQK